MSLREEQCQKVCRILDDVLANRPTERDSLIVATRNAFSALSEQPEIIRDEHCPLIEIPTPHGRLIDADRIDFRNDAMHDGKGNLVVADDFVSGVKWVNDCIGRTPSAILAPHGNLKDESDIISLIEVMFCKDKDGMEHAIQCVKDAPTVIEAEGENI